MKTDRDLTLNKFVSLRQTDLILISSLPLELPLLK
jgi:hypothetical protein